MSGPGDDGRRRRLGAAVIRAAALLAVLGAIDLLTNHAIVMDEAFWGVSSVLIGFAFVLFSPKVSPVGRVWAVIGGVAVAFGVVVVVRAAFPQRVKLTVTERRTGARGRRQRQLARLRHRRARTTMGDVIG